MSYLLMMTHDSEGEELSKPLYVETLPCKKQAEDVIHEAKKLYPKTRFKITSTSLSSDTIRKIATWNSDKRFIGFLESRGYEMSPDEYQALDDRATEILNTITDELEL